MICKNCNQEIPEDVSFCPNCGASVKEFAEEAVTIIEETADGAPEEAPEVVEEVIEEVDEEAVEEVKEAAADGKTALEAHIAGIPAAVAAALGKTPEVVVDAPDAEEVVAEAIAETPEAFAEVAQEAHEAAAEAASEAADKIKADRTEKEQQFIDGVNNVAAGVAAVAGAAGAAIANAADHAQDFVSDVAGDIAEKIDGWDGPKLEWGSPTLEEAEKKAEAYGSGLMDEIPVPEAPEPPRPEGIPEPEPAPSPAPEQKTPETTEPYIRDSDIPGKPQAFASLILGIIGTIGGIFLGFGFVSMVVGIIGVIMGNKAKAEGFEETMQKAGYILSIISIVIGALGLVACLACGAALGLGTVVGQ